MSMRVGKKNISACCQCPALVLDDEIYDAHCGFGAFGGKETAIPTPAPVYLLNYIYYDCPILDLVYGGND